MVKRMKLIIIITLLTLKAFCPSDEAIRIVKTEPIRPYEAIWKAVIEVESNNNPLAIGDKHLKEWSYGIAQLRKIRIDDYNKRNGSNYTIKDAFNPEISKRIFMYYASKIGPYDTDYLIRKWNGSGYQTYIYLEKVKSKL